MNIIIAGAGEVGRHSAEVLSASGHNIVMIDKSPETLEALEETLDLRTLRGTACDARVLREAGIERCDLLVAATDSDEINLLCATVGKAAGAKKTIARVHHSAYHPNSGMDYDRKLNIDALIFPENLTALEIARAVRNPGAMAIEHFARGRIEMQQLAVSPDADGLGLSLVDLRSKLPRGTLLGTVQRDGKSFIPDANTVIQPQDIITLLGETATFEKARMFFQTGRVPRRHLAIMGGSAMGVWLARQFRGRHFSVRLYETRRQRAEELSNKLEHVTIVQADPTNPITFATEHIQDVDVFIALSDNDEHNILAAVQAKSMGVQRTIVVIQQPTYLNILENIGIERAFSPRVIAAREIQRIADVAPLQRLATLAEKVADVYQIQPSPKSPAVGQPLLKLQFPDGCMVAAIQRQNSVRVPTASDLIEPGDEVVVIAKYGIEKQLRKFFLNG